jgi:alkanesulfonate monooxygenase SsuD/methylene tetrahydromethanopterin reductase-like flavin-dependent oxidoreductase (luciferase family)
MSELNVGITLPTLGDLSRFGVGTGGLASGIIEAARHVEALGLESVWVPDVVIGDGTPALESLVSASVAAAVTSRVMVGFGILVLPLRPTSQLAAQIATLQHLSGDRVLLGVGSGGFPDSPFWRSTGPAGGERGRRTDAALAALPGLIAGEATELDGYIEGATTVRLGPPATVPPILIGGNSEVAIRRAAAHGAGWFPSLLSADALRQGARRLAELAAAQGHDKVTITVGSHAMVGDEEMIRDVRDAFIQTLIDVHRVPATQAPRVPVAGGPQQIAEQLAAYRDAGADRIVLGIDGGRWKAQCELIAEAASMIRP